VRQLTDSTGAVTFARTYDPYGVTTAAAGSSASGYGFTGEWTDPGGLVYLRARHYAPGMGRFLTRDTWPGEVNRPHSLNRWNYVEGNSVNFVDPTGHIKEGAEAISAERVLSQLARFGVMIIRDWGYTPIHIPMPTHQASIYGCTWNEGFWKLDDLWRLESATDDLKRVLGGPNKIRAATGPIYVKRNSEKSGTMYAYAGILRHIKGTDIEIFVESNKDNEEWYKFTFVHEIGHIWDRQTGYQLSLGLMKKLGTWTCSDEDHRNPLKGPECWNPLSQYYDPDTGQIVRPELPPDMLRRCKGDPTTPGCRPYSYTYGGEKSYPLIALPAGAEDWANSLAYFVYPEHLQGEVIGLKSERRQYVKKQISNLP
jgi:RHS repeat-associated protein